MTGARAAVDGAPTEVRHRISTPASTIGPWLPEGALGESLADGRQGPTVGVPGLPTTIVLAVTAAATLALGIVPGSVLELAERAAIFVG